MILEVISSTAFGKPNFSKHNGLLQKENTKGVILKQKGT